MQGKKIEAVKARKTFIEFTMICEHINKQDATKRTERWFEYYSDKGYTLEWKELEELETIHLSPLKNLPLLIGQIKFKNNKAYLEKRLREETHETIYQ